MNALRKERTPGGKFLLVILVGFFLAIPLFVSSFLIDDRQKQNEIARNSIVTGWGGPQTLAGPTLVIPYEAVISEVEEENGKKITRIRKVERNLFLSPENANLKSEIKPAVRRRSIYEAVVYEVTNSGTARFILPDDFARYGVDASVLKLDRAEIRFGLSDPKGLFGEPPKAIINGEPQDLQPGNGLQETSGAGFFAWIDASALAVRQPDGTAGEIAAEYSFNVRGNGWLSMVPHAGDMTWNVNSAWPHPSFRGGFLPTERQIGAKGFTAAYRVANLAIGKSVVGTAGAVATDQRLTDGRGHMGLDSDAGSYEARIDLIQPVDFYDRINRSVKYGFLFIGFTFVTLLLFDLIGGVRISSVEYILVGAALILFFTMLLALAELVGFKWAYILASISIIGLIGSYASSVLKSWHRASYVSAMLAGLYGAIYILLSVEAYALLIGTLLLFVALAATMYLTRHIDWTSAAQDGDQSSFFDWRGGDKGEA